MLTRMADGKFGGISVEKEDSCGAGIRGQLFVSLNDGRGYGSSKETSLG
jgi:hypothetical protein